MIRLGYNHLGLPSLSSYRPDGGGRFVARTRDGREWRGRWFGNIVVMWHARRKDDQ